MTSSEIQIVVGCKLGASAIGRNNVREVSYFLGWQMIEAATIKINY